MGFVDMHIHSIYSDGTFTPEKIIAAAKARNVSVVSVCDHNEIRGTVLACKAAADTDMRCIPGVEIDSLMGGRDLHILCYGADLCHTGLLKRIRHARGVLDGMSTTLLHRMAHDFPMLDAGEYERFPHDTTKGGWKMLQYLVFKGITRELRDGLVFYDTYDVTYASSDFDSTEAVIREIHNAGGRAVLAHPGVSLPSENIAVFEKELHMILDAGADGIECFYPRHGKGLTGTCVRLCRDRKKMITAGSDCHGAFNHNEIGCTGTSEARIDLLGM